MLKTPFKLNKFLIIPIAIIMILLTFSYNASAQEGVVNTGRTDVIITSENGAYNPDGELPTATIDEASNWAQEKGYDIVKFLQKVIQPITIVTFIVGVIMCIFSFIIKNGVKLGLTVIIFSIIGYTAVLFANEIVQFLFAWLVS